MGFPCGLADKEAACNVGNLGLIPGLGRSFGEGKGYPLQYSGLENSMNCIVHEVTKRGWLRDEMVGWHHQLDGHEFEQARGVGDGQGSLACCSPWGHKELDMTEKLNWTEGHEGGALMNVRTVLIKETPQSFPGPLLPYKDTTTNRQAETQKRAFARTWSCSHHNFDNMWFM